MHLSLSKEDEQRLLQLSWSGASLASAQKRALGFVRSGSLNASRLLHAVLLGVSVPPFGRSRSNSMGKAQGRLLPRIWKSRPGHERR
jgi:hypothetical protein